MPASRRTRLSVIAAAASGALVVAMTGTALAAGHADRASCADIQDAVAPGELDGPCESIRTPRSDDGEDADDGTPATTPAAAPDEESEDNADGDDRDCPDFGSQAGAQAALEEGPDDLERLDADDDGVACEDHFGTEGRQVAVHPLGGVATGGAALT
jgi:hypothetical protein